MPVEVLTANTLAREVGVSSMHITRSVRRAVIRPDFTAGHMLLFRRTRLDALRIKLAPQ